VKGRQKGAQNKTTTDFRAALRKYCADRRVDPHFWMVDLLTRQGVKSALKFAAARELAAYLEPKLKSVELRGDPEAPLWVVYEALTPPERQARIAALLAKRGHGAD
jgi:hypothetical protein